MCESECNCRPCLAGTFQTNAEGRSTCSSCPTGLESGDAAAVCHRGGADAAAAANEPLATRKLAHRDAAMEDLKTRLTFGAMDDAAQEAAKAWIAVNAGAGPEAMADDARIVAAQAAAEKSDYAMDFDVDVVGPYTAAELASHPKLVEALRFGVAAYLKVPRALVNVSKIMDRPDLHPTDHPGVDAEKDLEGLVAFLALAKATSDAAGPSDPTAPKDKEGGKAVMVTFEVNRGSVWSLQEPLRLLKNLRAYTGHAKRAAGALLTR